MGRGEPQPGGGDLPVGEHEVGVAHGFVCDGELEDPVEDQAAAAEAAAVLGEDQMDIVFGQKPAAAAPKLRSAKYPQRILSSHWANAPLSAPCSA